jgi:hypothetical protein
MSLLEEVLSNDYEYKIEYAYYLALLDILMGVPLEEVKEDIDLYEHNEMYEFCAGIKKAIEFAKHKTYSEIQKEILNLKDKYE